MNISVSPELIEMTMKLVFTWGLHVYVSVQWLSHVWLFVTPWMLTCQASLSMQFLRQEYWSGLPFPSSGDLPNPGINSEVKWSEVKVAQSCLTLCDPMDYIVHGILQARILEWVAFPFSRGSSQPRDRTHVSLIAGRFLTSCAIRKAPGIDRETHKC